MSTRLVVALALALTLLGGVWTAADIFTRPGRAALAQQRTPVKVTRVYAGPDGRARAEEIPIALAPGATELSKMFDVDGLQFRRQAPGYFQDWHPAPRRQYVVTLSGQGMIELRDQKIIAGPGHVLLMEDVTGEGHISRGVGTEDRITLFIPLPKQ
jgi:hypothetical protein